MTPDYLLQTAPSANSALWLMLISVINGPTALTGRAVCVLQSPLYWAGHSPVRTWASARQHHGGRRSQAADPRVLPGGMGALVPGRLAVSLPVVCLVKALGDSGLKQEKGRVLGILRGRQGPLLTRRSPFSPRDPQSLHTIPDMHIHSGTPQP